MKASLLVLKNLNGDKPIGYLRSFLDGDTTTLQITVTSLKSYGKQVFAVAYSLSGDELCRKELALNGSTTTLTFLNTKMDLIIATDNELLSFVNLSGVNDKDFYFSRFIKDFSPYDDDAIADENYYLLEEKYNDLGEIKSGNFGAENALFNDGYKSKKEKIEEENYGEIHSDDGNQKSPLIPYYKTVQKIFDGAILRYRSTQKLTKTLPNSRFFELNSSGKTLFGVQQNSDKPLYFIYAVSGREVDGAPEKLKGKACFLPCSIFDLSGEGFWCLFQDATTGALIKSQR